MLYCYKPLDLFWTENENLEFKAFHVTPYLNDILRAGDIQTAMGSPKLTYQKGTAVRGRKNHAR